MKINKPDNMHPDTYASLVQAVDVLSHGYSKCADVVAYIVNSKGSDEAVISGLRERVTQLRDENKRLESELVAHAEAHRDELSVRAAEHRKEQDSWRTAMDHVTEERDYYKAHCEKLLEELKEERCLRDRAERRVHILEDRNPAEPSHDEQESLDKARAPGPAALFNRTDQCALNEMAFTTSDKYLREKLIAMAEDCKYLTPVQSALVAAAGDRLGVNVWPSLRQLRIRPRSKGDMAEMLYPESDGFTVDCAVPAVWLQRVHEMLNDEDRTELEEAGGLAAQFVTVYDRERGLWNGTVMPVTRAGIHVLAMFNPN